MNFDAGTTILTGLAIVFAALAVSFLAGTLIGRAIHFGSRQPEDRREPDAGGTGFTGDISDCQMGELHGPRN